MSTKTTYVLIFYSPDAQKKYRYTCQQEMMHRPMVGDTVPLGNMRNTDNQEVPIIGNVANVSWDWNTMLPIVLLVLQGFNMHGTDHYVGPGVFESVDSHLQKCGFERKQA